MKEKNRPFPTQDILIVLIFTLLITIPFLGQAWNIDEPAFLAVGRHILKDPLHSLDFYFNWYGYNEPYIRINTTPPLLHYLLALAIKITGGGEWPMRAIFLPFDLFSALFLYLIAARFLKHPLLPTLIVLASPAYLVNMPHLMPEKIMATFSFACLYGLLRGLDDDEPRWYWISAVSLGIALISKYAAVFLLLPAIGYSLEKGVAPKRLMKYLLISISGLILYLIYDHLAHHAPLRAMGSVFSSLSSSKSPALFPSYKMRSFLSFVGGLGIAAFLWPIPLLRQKPKIALALILLAAILFLPYFDPRQLTQGMSPIYFFDRLLGFIFSLAALAYLYILFSSRNLRGWPLWATWALSASLIQIIVYWSIVARLILFIIPPIVFAMAEKLELTLKPQKLKALMIFSLILTLSLSVPLARVDAAYTNSQRRFASWIKTHYIDQGKTVYFTGHWGFQYYMEKAGAIEETDSPQPMHSGNIFAYPGLNTNIIIPNPRTTHLDLIETIQVQNPIPLRLMEPTRTASQAGFYSSLWGFLPYTFSREPIEEFFIAKIKK